MNPFCKNFGNPQHHFTELKNKPSRNKLDGEFDHKRIVCNYVSGDNVDGIILSSASKPLSNWSVATEIKRLRDINTLKTIDLIYDFHYDGCCCPNSDPFNKPDDFQKRGTSTSNSPKFRCKGCGKTTSVLPSSQKCFTYNQKRNDILPRYMFQILNRKPVTRVCEVLNIGASTYYNKLEWVYQKCLEFLERHEAKPLEDKTFNTLWLNTAKFTYFLNNIRKKGKKGGILTFLSVHHFQLLSLLLRMHFLDIFSKQMLHTILM